MFLRLKFKIDLSVFMMRLKNYSCHNVFNKKKINTFEVLTFIKMRTVNKITTKFLTRQAPFKKQSSII